MLDYPTYNRGFLSGFWLWNLRKNLPRFEIQSPGSKFGHSRIKNPAYNEFQITMRFRGIQKGI